MAFIPCPNVFQVELVYSADSQIVEQVFHYAGLQTTDPADLTTMANDAIAQWRLTFKQIQSFGVALVACKVTSMTTESDPGVEIPVSTNNVGDQSGDMYPMNAALCVSFKTALRGRSYRGRTFVPCLPENLFVGNHIPASIIAEVNGYYANWDFLDVNGEPYAQVVLSRYHNGVPRAQGVYENILSWSTNPIMASQRRRLPGRGR